MWGLFQDLAKELFPNALIHVDSPDSYREHWTMHLNKALDNYRKYLRRENKEETIFKGLTPIAIGRKLIKRPENLKSTELEDLNKALDKDEDLKKIYDFRNEFQQIFDTHLSIEKATDKINSWLKKTLKFGNKHLMKLIQLFERHRNNIMNYFKTRLSSAAVEGKNNLLQTVKRFTFNMSNFQNFKYRVFAYNL